MNAHQRRQAQRRAAREWIASRPPHIQKMIAQRPFNHTYWMKDGQLVSIMSYEGNGIVKMQFDGDFMFVARKVFGVALEELLTEEPFSSGARVTGSGA